MASQRVRWEPAAQVAEGEDLGLGSPPPRAPALARRVGAWAELGRGPSLEDWQVIPLSRPRRALARSGTRSQEVLDLTQEGLARGEPVQRAA